MRWIWLVVVVVGCGPTVIDDVADLAPGLEDGTVLELVPEDWWRLDFGFALYVSGDGEDLKMNQTGGCADDWTKMCSGEAHLYERDEGLIAEFAYWMQDGATWLGEDYPDDGSPILAPEMTIGERIEGGALLAGTEDCGGATCLRLYVEDSPFSSLLLDQYSAPFEFTDSVTGRTWVQQGEYTW